MQTKLACVCTFAALAACSSDRGDEDARRRFIEKASHALHPSAAPLTESEIAALLDRSDEEIVAALYSDVRSRDVVFRMSLAFLGAPVDQLHRDGQWAAPPFDFGPAVSAARAFRDGGDPLTPLLTTRVQPSTGVVEPVREYLLQGLYGDVPPLEGTTAQRRAAALQVVNADLASFRGMVNGLTDPIDLTTLCDAYFNSNVSFVAFEVPDILGVPNPVVQYGNPLELDDFDAFPLDSFCFDTAIPTKADVLQHLDHQKTLIAAMAARLEPVFTHWESNPEVAFEIIDFDAIGFSSRLTSPIYGAAQFYPQFWRSAQNSSTNFNRRRGAYVLDRYFCDDLVPVGAALPTEHVQGKHASDPSCAACHFKLDPMAGFFRRNGFRGREYTDEALKANGNTILFDDFATKDFTDYESSWKAPAGAGRTFDIGYIRSTRYPQLNTYGSSLDDLDNLLRTAPEVERCFAQRMFEYFNGADQAVDPGFLDDVATDMHSHTSDRMARGLTRILTGDTFRTTDRNSTLCYDLAPGIDPNHRPPCEVASILRANCESCHGSQNPQAGLNLTTWQRDSDGNFGFASPYARTDTFQRMRDRLITSDPAKQMPAAGDMPLHQREQLVLWLGKMIEQK